MKRFWIGVLAGLVSVCCLSSAVAAGATTVFPEPPKGLITLDGRPAPALVLANADGVQLDLKQLRGQWVLVHFWASWCGPCRKEMPTLQRLTQIVDGQKLKLVLVNTAEDEDVIFTFLSVTSPELDSLLDPDGSVTERWQPRGLPSSFLVDPAGRLRYLALGGREWSGKTYLDFLQRLVGQAPSAEKR